MIAALVTSDEFVASYTREAGHEVDAETLAYRVLPLKPSLLGEISEG